MSAALSHRFGSVDARLSVRLSGDHLTSHAPGPSAPAFHHKSSTLDTSGLSLPTDQTMMSPADSESLQSEIYICQHCQKQFHRLCDLNKHAKSHSRPFKCSFQNCKYWSLGWPTAKELERHVNDKHLVAPQTYPCLFPHCSYRSKRESNCKQHMEKAHGWRYVRSRSTGRRVSRRVNSQLTSLQTFFPAQTPQAFHSTPDSSRTSSHQPGNDFVLFPQGQDHSRTAPSDDEYDDDGFLDVDDHDSQDSDVVIPWTSPSTRLRRRETFLRKFTQKFNPATEETDGLLIDPQLASMGDFNTLSRPNVADGHFGEPQVANHAATPTSRVPLENAPATSPYIQSMPNSPLPQALQQRPHGPTTSSRHGRSSSANLRQSSAGRPTQQAMPSIRHTSKRKEEDDDNEAPQKKFKPSPKADFKDNQMPDIFVAAFPDVYSRNTKPLYQSCETEHKDISTLVRHLSRAPHRLSVSEKWISSFDTHSTELSHAKVGVCRRCWETFTSRDAFNVHIAPTSPECERVSKGKKEKWQTLYNAFTPLEVSLTGPARPSVIRTVNTVPTPNLRTGPRTVHGLTSPTDDDDSAIPPPSPTTIDMGPHIPMELEGDGEVEKLRREIRQLRGIIQDVARVVFKPEVVDLSRLGQQLPAALLRAIEVPGTRQMGRLTFPGNVQLDEDTPDRESLVGHMNSQPTDVDREGMMNDIQQTLSRTPSGMSSDRSTIRHVSNSPPQRFEEYAGDKTEAQDPQPGSGNGPQPGWHPSTSLPDSGYGGSDIKMPGPHPSDPLLSSSEMTPDLFGDLGQPSDPSAYYISNELMEQFGGYSQQSSS